MRRPEALLITTHFPADSRHSSSGTYKRLRTIIDALRAKATLRVLFYYIHEHGFEGEAVSRAEATLRHDWQLDDVELVLCRQAPDPS